jgi:hypothetical protein
MKSEIIDVSCDDVLRAFVIVNEILQDIFELSVLAGETPDRMINARAYAIQLIQVH